MLGQGAELDSAHGAAGSAGNVRSRICARIIADVGPIAARWGVRVINFQLEVRTVCTVCVDMYVYVCVWGGVERLGCSPHHQFSARGAYSVPSRVDRNAVRPLRPRVSFFQIARVVSVFPLYWHLPVDRRPT